MFFLAVNVARVSVCCSLLNPWGLVTSRLLGYGRPFSDTELSWELPDRDTVCHMAVSGRRVVFQPWFTDKYHLDGALNYVSFMSSQRLAPHEPPSFASVQLPQIMESLGLVPVETSPTEFALSFYGADPILLDSSGDEACLADTVHPETPRPADDVLRSWRYVYGCDAWLFLLEKILFGRGELFLLPFSSISFLYGLAQETSLSPSRNDDSPYTRRLKRWKSVWQGAEFSDSSASRTASSSNQIPGHVGETRAMSLLERASLFEIRESDRSQHRSQQAASHEAQPKFKWGECTCGYSVCPWVFKTGKLRGELRLVCRGFLKRWTPDGKPLCWNHYEFPMERYHEISKSLKMLYQDLQNVMQRNSRRGKSTWSCLEVGKREGVFHCDCQCSFCPTLWHNDVLIPIDAHDGRKLCHSLYVLSVSM